MKDDFIPLVENGADSSFRSVSKACGYVVVGVEIHARRHPGLSLEVSCPFVLHISGTVMKMRKCFGRRVVAFKQHGCTRLRVCDGKHQMRL